MRVACVDAEEMRPGEVGLDISSDYRQEDNKKMLVDIAHIVKSNPETDMVAKYGSPFQGKMIASHLEQKH